MYNMSELLHGFGILSIYFAVAATTVLLLRYFVKIPDEIFRKTLHFVLLGSVFVFDFAYDTWYLAALSAIACQRACLLFFFFSSILTTHLLISTGTMLSTPNSTHF